MVLQNFEIWATFAEYSCKDILHEYEKKAELNNVYFLPKMTLFSERMCNFVAKYTSYGKDI